MMIDECYGDRGCVMGCSVFAVENEMFKRGDVWDRQRRGLKSVAVEDSKATPAASGPCSTEVVVRRGTGFVEGRVYLWLLPALCNAKNV